MALDGPACGAATKHSKKLIAIAVMHANANYKRFSFSFFYSFKLNYKA